MKMEFYGQINLSIYHKGTLPNNWSEIWNQLSGSVDAFICSVGTGGTLAGTSDFLREKIRI